MPATGRSSERNHDHDACDVIVAPNPEAGRIALSRLRLDEFRLMLGDLVPDDRARLLEELRGLPEDMPASPITPNNPAGRPGWLFPPAMTRSADAEELPQ